MLSDTAREVLDFVRENDVKFVRLAFCDLFGRPKNIAVMADQLPRAFEQGIPFDASAVPGFGGADGSDLLLAPDCSSVAIMPWRPAQGRVVRMICSINNPDGTPFEADGRYLLRLAADRAAEMGYLCRVGTECEFTLFKTDADGNPTEEPMDRGTYGDVAPLDKGENIRRAICLALESMGLCPESSHHEQGAGQNEVDFRFAEALTAADHMTTFQTVVKAIAMGNGLYASFLPKPLAGDSGNGLHINLSLLQCGKNIFQRAPSHCPEAESFIQGILNRVREITVFLNPLVNSYARFGSFEAPRYLTWSHQNRSQLIRIPVSFGEDNRMELRSADPSCNPYLAFALLLHAGLEGIEQKVALEPPCNRSLPEEEEGLPCLPRDLGEAIETAENSDFLRRVLPDSVVQNYLAEKRREWTAYSAADPRDYFLSREFRRI